MVSLAAHGRTKHEELYPLRNTFSRPDSVRAARRAYVLVLRRGQVSIACELIFDTETVVTGVPWITMVKASVSVILVLLGHQAQSFVLPSKHGAPGRASLRMMETGSGETARERRSVLLTGAMTALTAFGKSFEMRTSLLHSLQAKYLSLLCMDMSIIGLPLLFAPSGAVAKYSNIDEAREAGERKRDQLEKEKGPLIILDKGVR